MKNLIAVLLLMFIAASCSEQKKIAKNEKKATKFYNKAKAKSLLVVAKATRVDFPFTPTKDTIVKLDTITNVITKTQRDTVKCDSVGQVLVTQHDTIYKTNTIYKTVTNTVIDEAESYVVNQRIEGMQMIIDDANKENIKKGIKIEQLEKDKDKLQSKNTKQGWIILGLFIFIGLSIFLRIKKII